MSAAAGGARAVEAAARVLGDRARRDAPLGARTTYRVGGPAALLLEAAGAGDLALARAAVAASGVPVLVVGRGSNLLVAAAGFPGVAVVVGEGLGGIDLPASPWPAAGPVVRAGGGASLPVLARRAAAAGLGGLAWAVGIPGSVGGAVRMNAGGHGSDVAAVLVRAGVVDLGAEPRAGDAGEVAVDAAELSLGYRSSALGAAQVVAWAELAAVPRDAAAVQAEVEAVVAWRRDHQPGGQNAGSVFSNPPGDAAGRLVEAAGLKGFRLGSAAVSGRHANFVQADPGGSADDVLALAAEVRRRVAAETGVALALELRLAGFTAQAREEAGAL